jgi:hypothetical protein
MANSKEGTQICAPSFAVGSQLVPQEDEQLYNSYSLSLRRKGEIQNQRKKVDIRCINARLKINIVNIQ